MNEDRFHLVRYAADGLVAFLPHFSARESLAVWQKGVLIAAPLLLIAVGLFLPNIALLFFIFIGIICLLSAALRHVPVFMTNALEPFSFGEDKDRGKVKDEDLPIYTILVPLFDEAVMVPRLVDHLRALRWPQDRLDIKLILEQVDHSTRAAVAELNLGAPFEIVIVPDHPPRTKAKACNYALFFARGAFVTIYDAEDQPDRDQLFDAWHIFRHAPPDLACVQAPLNFFNTQENWLTHQFTIEYMMQFMFFLPFVIRMRLPVFLGGSSNHFRMDVLRALHGWDAFNVTEDADIGLRFSRAGFSCAMLSSSTLEEAPCQLGNWMKQRKRWIKGWLQTWLVAMRAPRRLLAELGAAGFTFLQFLVPIYVLALVMHLMIWPVIMLLAIFYPPSAAIWMASVLLISYVLIIIATQYGCLQTPFARERRLARHFWMIPAYWLLMGVAACQAVFDLIVKPYYWDKTRHGVSRFVQKNV